ncbi:RDD family protein [Kitasatospora purpeofusca]|nr:RDD family protein [Kitasatospora purpeofusca]
MGIEVGIAGGLMTAYLAGLSALAPAFAALQLLALFADTDIRRSLAGGWLVLQRAERGRTGQGLGGRLVGIVLVDEDTGAPIGPARAIWRGLLHALDAVPTFAGFVRPVTHVRRRTWADTISRSVVVRTDLIDRIALAGVAGQCVVAVGAQSGVARVGGETVQRAAHPAQLHRIGPPAAAEATPESPATHDQEAAEPVPPEADQSWQHQGGGRGLVEAQEGGCCLTAGADRHERGSTGRAGDGRDRADRVPGEPARLRKISSPVRRS